MNARPVPEALCVRESRGASALAHFTFSRKVLVLVYLVQKVLEVAVLQVQTGDFIRIARVQIGQPVLVVLTRDVFVPDVEGVGQIQDVTANKQKPCQSNLRGV